MVLAWMVKDATRNDRLEQPSPVFCWTMTNSEWQERMRRLLADYDPFRNLEHFESLVTETSSIRTWEDFQRWIAPFKDQGCFRGHGEANWDLVSTLERTLPRTITVETDETHWMSTQKLNPETNEQAVLLEFQRGAHQYYSATPALDKVVDWLALMQHYGAPTRLLDWTLSPYVALFFALQDNSEGDAALWAMDLKWLQERSGELLRDHYKDYPASSEFYAQCGYINRILLGDNNPYAIVSASPMQLNNRMLTQQGLLLCTLRHDVGFSTTLLSMLLQQPIAERQVVSKIVLKRDHRIEFLEGLRRMNIHSASLFPGLDGFSRSLATNLEIALAHQVEDCRQSMIEEDRVVSEALKDHRIKQREGTETEASGPEGEG
jgi:hypothetical protein